MRSALGRGLTGRTAGVSHPLVGYAFTPAWDACGSGLPAETLAAGGASSLPLLKNFLTSLLEYNCFTVGC